MHSSLDVNVRKIYFSVNLLTGSYFQLESLILAQNERWRHALHMQVERESVFGH